MQQEAFHHHVSLLASILRRIARLATLSNSDPDLVVNRKRSRQLFLEVFSGDFGKKLVQIYADMLQSGLPDNWDIAVGSDEETSRSAFVIILLCMTDVWRRFVHKFHTFPYRMFDLLDKSTAEFVHAWDKFQKGAQGRAGCLRLLACACSSTSPAKLVYNLDSGLSRSPATSKSTVACAQACPRCVDTCFSQKILEARCKQRNSKTKISAVLSYPCSLSNGIPKQPSF